MSDQARNFLRLRYFLDGLDGGPHRSFTPYEFKLHARLRFEAQYLIAGGPF